MLFSYPAAVNEYWWQMGCYKICRAGAFILQMGTLSVVLCKLYNAYQEFLFTIYVSRRFQNLKTADQDQD